jgi:hypothetical protein
MKQMIRNDVNLHAELIGGISPYLMLDHQVSAGMYTLPVIEPEDIASKDHKCITRSYASFDLPWSEDAKVGHEEYNSELIERRQKEARWLGYKELESKCQAQP